MIEVTTPMVATVLALRAEVGQRVEEGEALLVLESMKMEIPLLAPSAGVLTELRVAERETVEEGDVLAVIDTGDG